MKREIKEPGRGYAGLKKVPLFLYDSNGKYLKKYESRAAFCREHLPDSKGKTPLFDPALGFRSTKNYQRLQDGNFVASWRIGKENLRKFEAIANCSYCVSKSKDTKAVETYNLLGEKIATFKNMHTASQLTGISKTTIFHQLNDSKGMKTSKIRLQFRYV